MLLIPRSECQGVLTAVETALAILNSGVGTAALAQFRRRLIEAQAPPTERELAFYDAAYEEFHEDGKLEIEEDVTVCDLRRSPGDSPPEGSYVLGWIFVKKSLALSPEEVARESEQSLILQARERGVTPIHIAMARAIDPHLIVEGTLEEVIHLCHAQGDDPVTVFEVIDEWGEKIRGEKERTGGDR